MGRTQQAPAGVAALLGTSTPRFSDAERRRRRDAIAGLLDAYDLRAVVVYGAHRAGTAIGWLTGWPTTREAALVLDHSGHDVLYVQFRNHVPQARTLAHTELDVRWAGGSTIDTVLAELATRGPAGRVGIIGPLPHTAADRLDAAGVTRVGLDRAYTAMRLVKSDEEVAWLRAGAWLSDLGISALTDGLRPGITEQEAVALAEHPCATHGGSMHICYLASTAMDDPHRCVPGQFPTARRLARGDVVVVELSAAFHGYAGQVLRTFTVDAPLSPLHRRLHGIAEAARDALLGIIRDGTTPAQLRDAAGVIEDAGLTTCDDVVHGFGGGYLPPVVASRSHTDAPLPDQPLAAGMTVVVQPNVVTLDGRAGVQTGELVLVTPTGYERLHTATPGVIATGPAGAVPR
ncbi:MAG TPA: M24 family metallopeptidase [Euzebyales bacterium]|nr:M24 family metallopeptidase [Euzebyales bacterium]